MDKIQEEIIEEFSVFEDWLDKYDYLIGLSETLAAGDLDGDGALDEMDRAAMLAVARFREAARMCAKPERSATFH